MMQFSTSDCGTACLDPAQFNPYGEKCTDYDAFYACLDAIPCITQSSDGGELATAVVNCKAVGGCQ